ncbi:iron ABC transporter permease [Phytohabitans suffuscus]|uniref:Iron-hydroxamate transporter permease subunit n=1 Tax=Phytohabitans suffuscus TaxID=624315 RepID=A0A6F8YQF8_9ACTN|nr:iron ABC transporter permease [Phytohabitans suffuscus]BCB88141.1 iron-hydroxamate transporter permease subunit [Phytohabitans suffuscus]
MSHLAVEAPPAPDPKPAAPPPPPVRPVRVALLAVASLAGLVLLAAVHLTQGTSDIGVLELIGLRADDDTWRVLVASRLPRLLAGLAVGVALGAAGAVLQSLARNPLASPDTLAVNAGAYLAVVAAAAFGLTLPIIPSGGLAFLGGLAAAAFVLMLSAGGTAGPTRLILAGTATAFALNAFTVLLMLLFQRETVGYYSWGNGTLVQGDLRAVTQMAPVIAVGVAGCLALGRRLDVLALGDDTATVLGLHVRRTRLAGTVLAVLLATAAVVIAGPVGFVGLCAPVLVRLVAPAVPGLYRHRLHIPFSALAGVVVVLGSDVLLRLLLGGQAGVDVPTGVVTSMFGAVLLVWLARRYRDAGPVRGAAATALARVRTAGFFRLVLAASALLLVCATVLGLLAGDTWLLTGDVANWLAGRSGPAVTYVLDQRYPRVLAALLAGAALAVAGTAVQATCRNPLAEPGILGVTAGAGVGAITLITMFPAVGLVALSAVAGAAALLAFALVYGLAWRGGLASDRLVLIGVGVFTGGTAVITFIIIATDPWNTGKALTWLSGSTYGRTAAQVAPVALALLLLTPLVAGQARRLDLLALDDDTPRVLGVRLERTRLAILTAAALLTSTAVCAVGVIGFVGLVAPHAARALVGGRHTRLLPVAALLGALLVSLADTLGRTAIAPAQIPAGLVTAMIGAPYFVWLLWRSRARTIGG